MTASYSATIRMVPKLPLPAGATAATGTANGREYSCQPGSYIDVSEGDAAVLEGQAFVRLGTVGTTAQRPAYPPNGASDPRIISDPVGALFIDTSVGKVIRYVGNGTWVDHMSAAAA